MSTGRSTVLGCADLDATVDFFTSLGYRLDVIWPADDPSVAVLSHGDGPGVRLVRRPAPDLERDDLDLDEGQEGPVPMPAGKASFELTHVEDTDSGVGRAGMHYRDLLPARQDGRFIASHILIPDGGPVPDYVHHHRVRFQLIYCAAGWVRVVHEDQGPPFVLAAGDCVLQPPGIRHRVLEASPGLQVVEIGCPAEHPTFVEHSITLPTDEVVADRRWDAQGFVRHVAVDAAWEPWRATGFECRDTGIAAATDGLAAVRVVRPCPSSSDAHLPPHGGEFLFWYVLSGVAVLRCGGRSERLAAGTALAAPADVSFALVDVSEDLELLEVMLPS